MHYVVKYCRYFASPRWSLHFDFYNVNCEHSTGNFNSHCMQTCIKALLSHSMMACSLCSTIMLVKIPLNLVEIHTHPNSFLVLPWPSQLMSKEVRAEGKLRVSVLLLWHAVISSQRECGAFGGCSSLQWLLCVSQWGSPPGQPSQAEKVKSLLMKTSN